KMVAFEMRDKPWSAVLEWLADQTGIPVNAGPEKPTGTMTFIAPKSAPKEYTIPQVIDILNENLSQQKLLLIRREASYTIIAADREIDPAIVPRVEIEDLNTHGKTELAQIVLQLKSLVAEDLVGEIKKMMGPFHQATAITPANQLVLQDTV